MEQVRTSGPAVVYPSQVWAGACWASCVAGLRGRLMVCPLPKNRRSLLPNPSSKRKVDVKSSRNGAADSQAKDVKHLASTDSRKVGGMRSARDVLLKSPANKLEDHDLLCEIVHARSSSLTERERGADVPLRSSGRLHQSKDGDRTRRSAHDLAAESGAVKCGVDSALLTHLEVRLERLRRQESHLLTANPEVDKFNPVGDAGVSDLLKTNFLSSQSTSVELVDQIHQVGDLCTFSSLSLEKQREATFHLFQKGVAFAIETIRNSSVVAPSSAADLVSRKDAYFRLERKNANISLSYDKLLARFRAYQKSAKESKFEATMHAYKLGYMHYADRTTPFYAIVDVDIETLYPTYSLCKEELKSKQLERMEQGRTR
ncbi:unnamed protein product [Prunus armeniaca]